MNAAIKQVLRKCMLYLLIYLGYILCVALGFLVVQKFWPQRLQLYAFVAAILATLIILYKLRWVMFPDLCRLFSFTKSNWDKFWNLGVSICKKTK